MLPESFLPIKRKDARKPIYTSSMGNLYVKGSKDCGLSNKTWAYNIWPSIVRDEKIAYIVLAADFKGIFLIPSEVFFAYRDRHPVGARNSGEDFSILRVGSRYIRHESKCDDEDLTRYFIPYTHISITNN